MNDFKTAVPFSGIETYLGKDYITASREDEAIGIAVGAYLAGKNPVVGMQNSGLGNCFDILTSLLKPYGINIDLLIDNRVEPEHHALMGSCATQLLRTINYNAFRLC